MKSNLRNSVSEVYKKSNNEENTLFNNSLLDKNAINTSDSIITNNNNNNRNRNNNNRNRNNNKNRNSNSNNNETYISVNEDIKQSRMSLSMILFIAFFLIITSLFGLFVYFKETILEYIKNTFYGEDEQKHEDEINDLKKQLEDSENKVKESNDEDVQNVNERNRHHENSQKEQENSSKHKKNESLKKLYSEDQNVKEGGYCYIGTDDNMRHCVEVYNGDICESGDVFKRIDKCLMPESFN